MGDTVALMNEDGWISLVEIKGVQKDETGTAYIAPYIEFTSRIVDES